MELIRKTLKKDIDTLIKLLKEVANVHADIRPDLFIHGKTKYNSKELEEIINDELRPIFVYEDNNIVYGYCFCEIIEIKKDSVLQKIKTLYIDDLCVDEAKRSNGIGKKLYDYVINYARTINCYNVTLNVWEGNDLAKAFYNNLGLKPQKVCLENIL